MGIPNKPGRNSDPITTVLRANHPWWWAPAWPFMARRSAQLDMRFIACRKRCASPAGFLQIVFGIVFLQFLRLSQQLIFILRFPIALDACQGFAIKLQR